MKKTIFNGVIPPVPTLFNEKGLFDPEAQAKLLDKLLLSQVDGLFFLGSAGEFAHMSDAQRQEVAEFCVQYVNGRKPVLIGIAHSGTLQTIAFGQHAKKIGADGVVVINSWYNPLSEDNLLAHYKKIASQLELPIILYNFPALTGQSLSVNLVRTLAEQCPNIVGIKDTVDCISHIREVIHAVKPIRADFAVFAGYDEYLLSTLILGGDGCIPASANFAPELTCGIYRAWQQKDLTQAVKLQQKLSWIPPLYSIDLPFYNAVKYAIRLIGVDIPVFSLPPASPLTEVMKKRIEDILIQSELIQK